MRFPPFLPGSLLLVLAAVGASGAVAALQAQTVDLPHHRATTWEAVAETFTPAHADRAGTRRGADSPVRHTRYRQFIHGIPVEAGTVIAHEGPAAAPLPYSGRAYRQQPLARQPAFAKTDAEDIAARHFAAAGPTSRHRTAAAELRYVDATYPRLSGALRLAYRVDVRDDRAHRRDYVYLDAETAELIARIPRVCHATVPGSGMTQYYGRQTFPVDSVAPERYRLADPRRAIVVESERLLDRVPESTTAHFDDSGVTNGTMATDVYYGTSRFHDLMTARFGWDGLDGQGEAMVARIGDAADANYVNAYWNGSTTFFGAGDCHYEPLTTLDVVGHEFQHGITQRTSALIYSDESGALNEGLSDIFGKALERVEQPGQFSWELGNRFAESSYATSFRDMSSPRRFSKPAAYGGTGWRDGGSVHTNSGPLGHWFYLLVDGGRGTNEFGTDFEVVPLGLDDALELCFLVNRDYLTEASGYGEFYAASLAVAEQLFGAGDARLDAIREAWAAVNIFDDNPGGVRPPEAPDFAVASYGSARLPLCPPADGGAGLVIPLRISNYAGEIDSGEHLLVTLLLDGDSATHRLDLDPYVGVSYIRTEVEVALAASGGEHDLTVRVDYPGDERDDNDERSVEVRVVTADYSLAASAAAWATPDCADDARTLSVTLANRGCAAWSEGVELDLFDASGALVDTRVVSPGSIVAGRTRTFDLALAAGEYQRVRRVALRAPSDTEAGDDEVVLELPAPAAMRADDVVTLEQEGAALRFLGDSRDNGFLGRIPSDDGFQLGTTGSSYYGSRVPCLDPEENFVTRYSEPPVLCLDFAGTQAPRLTFDVTHYAGTPDSRFPELSDAARALMLEYEDGDGLAVRELIAPTPDGARESRALSLPDDYRGPLRVLAYNASGSRFSYDGDVDLERYDYILLDDLAVASALSTREATAAVGVAPNPVASAATLTLPEAPGDYRVSVYTALGQAAMTLRLRGGRHEIDLAALAPGAYVLSVVTESGDRSSTRIVKR